MSDKEKKELCPFCESEMIWITVSDKQGNVTRRKICKAKGVCDALRKAKEAWRRRAA